MIVHRAAHSQHSPAQAEPDVRQQPEVTVLAMQHLHMKNYNYLVRDTDTSDAVIIDPAWEIDKIDRAIVATNSRLREILLTHAHSDHVHLAREVSERYDCPIRMSKEEIASSGYDAPRLRPIDGPWAVGKMRIEPILTPGHTPGCICYVIGANLFTGDVLFAEGCGICPNDQAAYAMYDSLSELKHRIDPSTAVYPGHSYGDPPGQKMERLLKQNIYLQFRTPESFVAFRMRSGQSMTKIFDFR
ncbi:MAG: MBL fold metallo-hydrolase [Lysobacteraceae bacterium]|nr:MAG: MBL fold metallo-hydrolase [Xanthomonadaceae bacterium]